MPDLLTYLTIAAKLMTLAWSLASWISIIFAIRFKEQPLDMRHAFGAPIATTLFIGLMGWLD